MVKYVLVVSPHFAFIVTRIHSAPYGTFEGFREFLRILQRPYNSHIVGRVFIKLDLTFQLIRRDCFAPNASERNKKQLITGEILETRKFGLGPVLFQVTVVRPVCVAETSVVGQILTKCLHSLHLKIQRVLQLCNINKLNDARASRLLRP
jgi:hypothetical protein